MSDFFTTFTLTAPRGSRCTRPFPYSRPSLQDKSPYELFTFLHGTDLLDQLGIHSIPANEILLKPRLIP